MVGSFHGEIGEANALYHGYIPRGKRVSLIATNNRWGSRRRWHVLSLIYSHSLGESVFTPDAIRENAPENPPIETLDLSPDSCAMRSFHSSLLCLFVFHGDRGKEGVESKSSKRISFFLFWRRTRNVIIFLWQRVIRCWRHFDETLTLISKFDRRSKSRVVSFIYHRFCYHYFHFINKLCWFWFVSKYHCVSFIDTRVTIKFDAPLPS